MGPDATRGLPGRPSLCGGRSEPALGGRPDLRENPGLLGSTSPSPLTSSHGSWAHPGTPISGQRAHLRRSEDGHLEPHWLSPDMDWSTPRPSIEQGAVRLHLAAGRGGRFGLGWYHASHVRLLCRNPSTAVSRLSQSAKMARGARRRLTDPPPSTAWIMSLTADSTGSAAWLPRRVPCGPPLPRRGSSSAGCFIQPGCLQNLRRFLRLVLIRQKRASGHLAQKPSANRDYLVATGKWPGLAASDRIRRSPR